MKVRKENQAIPLKAIQAVNKTRLRAWLLMLICLFIVGFFWMIGMV